MIPDSFGFASEEADVEIAEAYDVISGFEFGNAEQFAHQSLADKHTLALPHDLAAAAYPPDLVLGVVPGVCGALRHLPRRWDVEFGRRSLAERFVRTLL